MRNVRLLSLVLIAAFLFCNQKAHALPMWPGCGVQGTLLVNDVSNGEGCAPFTYLDIIYSSTTLGGSLSGTLPNPTIANSGVTPGSYNSANITVSADGRITSASNGSAGSRTFSYPSRALNSCFQVSNTKDSDVNYSVDITALITLGGGTGLMQTFTNSGCTTGAQSVSNGAVSSVAIGGTSSIPLHAQIPAGKWIKITGTASGGGSASIDAVQAETIQP